MNNLITVGDTKNSKETMTSIQIAELSDRNHKDVMRSIREMESAWEKVNGRSFALVEYKDAKGEMRPMYELTKTECLYIATKFNDEARAKLVLRWEELEKQSQFKVPTSFKEALLLAVEQQEVIEEQQKQLALKDTVISEYEPKANYYDTILSSKDAINISIIAKDYGMSAKTMNKKLHDLGVIYKSGDTWLPYQKYSSQGYTKTTTIAYNDGDGSAVHSKWTQKGRLFLYQLLKENDIFPLVEQPNK